MTSPYNTARMLKEKYMTPEPPRNMYIKIVPDAEPNHNGVWIAVPRREEKFRSFVDTVELYREDIKEGWHAVSFVRFPEQRWGGTIEGE